MAKVKFKYEKRWLNYKSGESLGEGSWQVVKDIKIITILEQLVKKLENTNFTMKYKIKTDKYYEDEGVIVVSIKNATKNEIIRTINEQFEEWLDLKW